MAHMNTGTSSKTQMTSPAPVNNTTPDAAAVTTVPFSSISELFQQSWQRFTNGALNALFLSLLAGLAYLVAALISGGLFIGLTASIMPISEIIEVVSEDGLPAVLSQLGPSFVGYAAASVGLLAILMMIIGAVYMLGLIYTFAWAENKPKLGEITSTAFSKIGVFILLNLALGFMIFGGMWVFFIPGIIMSIFFSFATYELLLEGKRPFEALKGSVAIIAANFGKLIGRYSLLAILYFVISFLLPTIFEALGENIAAAYAVVDFFLSQVMSWFSIAFAVTLYSQAKAATPEGATSSGLYKTLVAIAIIGWVLFALVAIVVTATAGDQLGDYFNKSSQNQMDESNYSDDMYDFSTFETEFESTPDSTSDPIPDSMLEYTPTE